MLVVMKQKTIAVRRRSRMWIQLRFWQVCDRRRVVCIIISGMGVKVYLYNFGRVDKNTFCCEYF